MTEAEKRLLELVLTWQADPNEIVSAKDSVFAERCSQKLIDECVLEEGLHKAALGRYRDFLKRIKLENPRGVASVAMSVARNLVWPLGK
jgi:hypothetical protein